MSPVPTYNLSMKKTCTTCGGSGQVGFFQGESRFLLTWEECPQCCGIGFPAEDDDAGEECPDKECGGPSKTGKKQKKSR